MIAKPKAVKARLMPTKDHRSPVAKALDAYLESDEGQRCCAPKTLGDKNQRYYLRNRIESAWISGATWGVQSLGLTPPSAPKKESKK